MALSWWQRLVVRLFSHGPVPRHVAFIMDGNRRFARRRNEIFITGHELGFDTFSAVCEACVELGVKFVTFYAFALGNFFRPKEEVDSLFELAERRLQDKNWFLNTLCRHQIRVRLAGERRFLPPNIQSAADTVIKKTALHDRMVLTLCIAYGSRYEMMSAALESERRLGSSSHLAETREEVRAWQEGLDKAEANRIEENATTEPASREQLDQLRLLYTQDVPPPDVLLRTSGEKRISDFLLYQCAEKTSIWILDVLWPDLGLYHLLFCLLHYQLFSPCTKVDLA